MIATSMNGEPGRPTLLIRSGRSSTSCGSRRVVLAPCSVEPKPCAHTGPSSLVVRWSSSGVPKKTTIRRRECSIPPRRSTASSTGVSSGPGMNVAVTPVMSTSTSWSASKFASSSSSERAPRIR